LHRDTGFFEFELGITDCPPLSKGDTQQANQTETKYCDELFFPSSSKDGKNNRHKDKHEEWEVGIQEEKGICLNWMG